MSEVKTRLSETVNELVDELKQERDELQVKLHLAKLDVSDEWKKVETKLGKLEDKARELGGATAEASHDIGAATKLLAEEIRDGFKKIGRHF